MQFIVSVDVCFCISNSNKTLPPGLHARRHQRVPNRFFGTWDFPYLKLGIWDFKAKSGRDSGLKLREGGGMPKMTLGIMGLDEILGRDYGTEEPYWGPSHHFGFFIFHFNCCSMF